MGRISRDLDSPGDEMLDQAERIRELEAQLDSSDRRAAAIAGQYRELQAQAAAMRETLERCHIHFTDETRGWCTSCGNGNPHTEDCLHGAVEKALSSDAGKGWISPEEAHKLMTESKILKGWVPPEKIEEERAKRVQTEAAFTELRSALKYDLSSRTIKVLASDAGKELLAKVERMEKELREVITVVDSADWSRDLALIRGIANEALRE